MTRSKHSYRPLVVLLVAVVVVLTSCSLLSQNGDETPAPAETDTPTSGGAVTAEANVDEIQVLLLESFPVQVNVIASGTLPDGCTSLQDPEPRQEGNTFVVNLTTTRLEDEVCTQAIVPFDKIIPLPVEGLPAGTYTVAVNGVTDTFTLDVDNVPQEGVTPTAVPGDAQTGSIDGTVWHDLCAVAGGEGGEPAVPSAGCTANADGTYQANGILEADEPGIEDVRVDLGTGACPATGMLNGTTGADGGYGFDNLEPGTYCVSVDALETNNSTILIPGSWTSPVPTDDSGVATATVNVTAGGTSSDIDFGWDYQFLPEPEAGPTPAKECTDTAEFLADITVQDNEIVPPTYVFTKTWQLQNSGTCTWTTDYDLVFAGGDPMNEPGAIPLTSEVPPTSTVQLSVELTSPQYNGTYNGLWSLRNELGATFGIPDPFWVQIVITSAIPSDGGYITGLIWADECTPPDGEDAEAPEGCVANDDGSFRADGEWTAVEPRIEGLTVSLAEGACPATEALTTTTTDEAGRYVFTGLDAGTYCVYVVEDSSDNEGVLLPGAWTAPEVDASPAAITIEVGENEPLSDVNFGWDYQFD